MFPDVDSNIFAALKLDEIDRRELLNRIEASLTPRPGSLHPDWKAVIQRRSTELDSGAVEGIPWEEVCREADTRYGPDPELTAELNRRWADYLSGKMQTIPLEEVYRIIEEQLAETDPAEQPPPPLSEAKKQELRRRIADADANPSDSVPWEEAEAAAMARFSG